MAALLFGRRASRPRNPIRSAHTALRVSPNLILGLWCPELSAVSGEHVRMVDAEEVGSGVARLD